MSKQNIKLILGLSKRWCDLADKQSDIFWKERPWLENPNHPKPWTILETEETRREYNQLQLEMDKTNSALIKVLDAQIKEYDEKKKAEEAKKLANQKQLSMTEITEALGVEPQKEA